MFSTKNNFERIDKINKRVDVEKLFEITDKVSKIILEVKKNGDRALANFTEKFDRYEVDLNKDKPFLLSTKNTNYFKELDEELQNALIEAKDRITKYHEHDLKNLNTKSWSFQGDYQETLGADIKAIDSVALYIPGGQAALVSTVLMTAIPAISAGVKKIAIFSPPPVNKAILSVAELLNIDEVYTLGGAQAVAAAAFGTQSIPAFDKIVGPGNIYVSEAKKLLNGIIGIDGVYGPSELAIIADESVNLNNIAIDLLSQLEHGSGLESVLFVSNCKDLVRDIKEAVIKEINLINYNDKQRETLFHSLDNWSDFIFVETLDEAVELVNYYAPEHLELLLNDQNLADIKAKIKNAGAIFIGANSCESLGDYLAGPSHCLPTAGSARFSSGLQVSDFFKKTSIIDFNHSKNINELLRACAIIARAEGLEAHAKAAEYRILN